VVGAEKDEVEGLKPDVQEGADEADVGVERANTIGSWKLSAKGRTRTSPARLGGDMAAAAISEAWMKLRRLLGIDRGAQTENR